MSKTKNKFKVLSSFFERKEYFFFVNILVLLLLLWLKFSPAAELDRILGSPVLLVRNLSPLIIFLLIILFGNKSVNRMVVICFISVFLVGEILVRVGLFTQFTPRNWDDS